MKNELTKEQIIELEMLATEIEAEAIQMKLDYEATGSEHSGSVVFVNQDSPLLEDENVELGTTMLVSSTQRIKRKLEEEGEDNDSNG
jgi:hypothetical protein